MLQCFNNNNSYSFFNADCYEFLENEPPNKYDLIIIDPPYSNKTRCEWDKSIDIVKMWQLLNKVIKKDKPIIIFAQEPFTSLIIYHNIKNFKYKIVWDKKQKTGFLNARRRPLKQYEEICIFNNKNTYYPQMIKGKRHHRGGGNFQREQEPLMNSYKETETSYSDEYYPTDILTHSVADHAFKNYYHPTQKPVKLLETLIKQYSTEQSLILDCFAGGGSTSIACLNTKRSCVSVEKERRYFQVQVKRFIEAF